MLRGGLRPFCNPAKKQYIIHSRTTKSPCFRIAAMSEPEKLQIIFVSTEVANWSKVGGLGDVIDALPAALAARGHDVITIAPRYEPYPDTEDIEVTVPLQLPYTSHSHTESDVDDALPIGSDDEIEILHSKRRRKNNPHDIDDVVDRQRALFHAQLYGTRHRGVHRVFVDHPMLYSTDIYGGNTNTTENASLTYMESGHCSNLDIRYSILCQASLVAAAKLFPVHRDTVGDTDERSEDRRIIFVSNDWPTALQIVRLQYMYRSSIPPETANHCNSSTSTDEMSSLHSFLKERLAHAVTAFCIHNLAYQGIFPASSFSRLCLPSTALHALDTASDWRRELLLPSCMDDTPTNTEVDQEDEMLVKSGGELNWMRSALISCDQIITVSPNYAQEIQQKEGEMGCGLQDILETRGVVGIMNGIDTEEWNPGSNTLLPPAGRYTSQTFVPGKAFMKVMVQERIGLDIRSDAALVVFIGRLTQQKGVDVLLGALPALFAGPPAPAPVKISTSPLINTNDLDAASLHRCHFAIAAGATPTRDRSNRLQIAMLGTGDAWMQSALDNLHTSFPGRAAGISCFSEELAHWLLAAADYVIVPSRFEPCGLVAQSGVHYGAVPIVTAVGGLKDLVDVDIGYALSPWSDPGDGAGQSQDIQRLVSVLREAEKDCGSAHHRGMQRRCMELDVSWDKPAEEWEHVLRGIVNENSPASDDDD